MKIEIPKCPECDEPVMGTCDTIPGCALTYEVEGAPGFFEYEGETEVFWDGQMTDEQGGVPVVQCHNGHTWATPIDWDADAPEPEPAPLPMEAKP